ncbi:hypothetical protein Ocin01_11588 [Orchesella cincta]|uniref:Uncharacterized protein n=1 Tax=Orchesella cincta TaxID=48709 RepID=A0A1D2MPY6_ORCCI|nr:hypothetical protein Ocin01_11588 [Orchesella cincta]
MKFVVIVALFCLFAVATAGVLAGPALTYAAAPIANCVTSRIHTRTYHGSPLINGLSGAVII